MTTYSVIDRSTGGEVYSYAADSRVEWAGFEFATHDHVEVPDAVHVSHPPPLVVWTPIDFLRRFTPAERILARAERKADPILDDFYSLLERAAEVRSDDADVALGLQYMMQMGYLSPGRSTEILGGA